MLAALLAATKAIPALERLVDQFVALWVAHRLNTNLADETAKNQRNAAAVAAAGADYARARGVHLCPTCLCPCPGPGGGQHPAPHAAP